MERSIFQYKKQGDQAKHGNWRKSFIILIVGLVLTVVAAFLLKQDEKAQAKIELTLIGNEIRTRIQQKLNSHALLLRNGCSFFVASDSITREEWRLFIKHSRLDINLPGIQGVGFSFIIQKDQLQNHIQTIRKEGFSDYTLKPAGEREVYTSILYIEPFSGSNLRSFGYDMFSEPIRRQAMEKARDLDLATLSGKVILVQESGDDLQAGTLMYVPVYRNGMPAQSIEQRRKAIIGWVYSPFRMDDLMTGILGRWDTPDDQRIRLQISEDESSFENLLLFDSQMTDSVNHQVRSMTITLPLVFNERKWILTFSQSVGPLSFINRTVLVVLVAGILISFLLFALFLSLSKTRSRMQISEHLASQLKESEEKYRALIENATEGIYVVQGGRIAFANMACASITGIPLTEMPGMPVQEFFDTEESEEQSLHHHGEVMTGKTNSMNGVFPIKNRREERRWLLINSARIMWNGSAATLNLATDISERKQAEEVINRKNEELQNLNATKDKFFSIIAHDLRSPFNSLLGLTQMMTHDFNSLSMEQIQQMVEIMGKSADNLYRLLENLLQWSQIQSGTIPFNPELVQLQMIVDESIEIIEEPARIKEIEITSEVAVRLTVLADRHMLQTVIRNLIFNAVKFTPHGGKVSLRAKATNDNNVEISIYDTGIGMSQDMVENLFKIDVKTNRLGTESEPSSGLGLLLSKEFIEKHGGEIWVESEVGKGSVFHFTIPCPTNASTKIDEI